MRCRELIIAELERKLGFLEYEPAYKRPFRRYRWRSGPLIIPYVPSYIPRKIRLGVVIDPKIPRVGEAIDIVKSLAHRRQAQIESLYVFCCGGIAYGVMGLENVKAKCPDHDVSFDLEKALRLGWTNALALICVTWQEVLRFRRIAYLLPEDVRPVPDYIDALTVYY